MVLRTSGRNFRYSPYHMARPPGGGLDSFHDTVALIVDADFTETLTSILDGVEEGHRLAIFTPGKDPWSPGPSSS